MTTHTIARPSWSTASFGDGADTSLIDLSALGDHLDLCRRSRGRMFAFHSAAQSLHGAVASRFVTTLAVAALLIGFISLVL